MKRRRILTVIPARKGSERVPRKAMREICGKPLVQYAIDVAKGASFVNDIVVSTDDSDVAAIARLAEVDVLTRPNILATDHVTLALVMRNILELFDKAETYYDAILSLQCTSPLVSSDTVDKVITKFHSGECSAVATVTRIRHGHPHLSKRLRHMPRPQRINYHTICLLANDFVDTSNVVLYPKRNLEKAYYFNGAMFLRDRSLLVDYDSDTNALGNRVVAVEMEDEESVNIDTEFDFKIVKLLLEARRNK